MLQKALAARLGIGRSVLSTSLEKTVHQLQPGPPATGFAAGAALSIEEDFELGSDFLVVFERASERVAGFVTGCAVIGIAWVALSFL